MLLPGLVPPIASICFLAGNVHPLGQMLSIAITVLSVPVIVPAVAVP